MFSLKALRLSMGGQLWYHWVWEGCEPLCGRVASTPGWGEGQVKDPSHDQLDLDTYLHLFRENTTA